MRGVGIGMSTFFAGSNGFDGLFVIKPDGRLYAQSGIGNFGTESVMDVHRVAAEIIGIPWEKVEIITGQHGQAPAVDLHLGRQPDDARDDARRARGGHGREAEAAGDRRQDARRRARAATRWPASACSAAAAA